MIKAAILAILVVVLAWQAASCHHRVEAHRLAAQRQEEAFAESHAYEASPLPLDPFQRRAAIADSMRLRPDRRFLLAAGEIAHLTGDAADRPPEAAARFDGSSWTLTVGNAALGEVPELPDFPDLLRPLVALAERRLAAAPLSNGAGPATQSDLMWEPDARKVLPAQLSRWTKGERTVAVLHQSACAAVSLAFYQVDKLGIADSVSARAIALVALDIAAGKAPVAGEQAMLAAALGYGRAARELSAQLPEDSLRLYLAGDDAGLRDRAGLRDATAVDRYLRVRRSIDRNDSAGADEFLQSVPGEERLDVAVLAQILRQGRMDDYATAAFGLPLFVLTAAEDHPVPQVTAGDDGDVVREALAAIAAELKVPPTGDSGRLEAALAKGDAGVSQYLRAFWISALERQGDYFAKSQADRERSEQFSRYLARDPSPAVKTFQKWFAARTSLMTGRAASAFAAIEHLDGVGGEATATLLSEANDQSGFFEPKALRAARKAIPRLDSRVSHRMALAGLAWGVLQDVPAAQRLYQSAFESDPEQNLHTRVWLASMGGGSEDLLRIGSDKLVSRSTRLYALERLLDVTATKDREPAYRALQALVDEDPKDFDAMWSLARRLRREERYDEARAVLHGYLRVADGPGIGPANVRGALSRYAFLQGHYQEGFDVVEPALPVYTAEALEHAALNLAGLGRAKEARQWADALVQRYPDGDEIAAAAEVEWLLGDFGAAARRMSNSPAKLSWVDYRRAIGERFVRRFGKKPKDAVAAVQSMANAGLGAWEVDEMAVALDEAKLYETAFAVHSSLRHQDVGSSDLLHLRAGRSLREVRGAGEARAWFAKVTGSIDDSRGRDMALGAFRDHRPEEVWELIPDPKQPGGDGETTWMLRAAAVALQGDAATAERREILKRHYATAPDSQHVRIGRYLTGLATDAETAGIVKNLPASCEVPYYFGIRAAGEKRTRDALDWYRVAIECGDRGEAEYTLAQNELYWFRGRDTPFAFLR